MADAAADATPTPRLPAFLARPLDRLKASPLARREAWLPLLLALGMLAGVLWLALAPPERTPLFRNLPDADKAAVVQALEEAGFRVEVDPRTGAVLLPPSDHARARMMLAGEGLPRAAPGALDLIGDMPLGTSRAVESARLRLAAERELARAIETLDGVEQARVLVALPEPSPFVRDRPPPKASVTVTLARGRTLSAEEVRAIAHLVAGAVPGLAPDSVAIADQTGRLLAGAAAAAGETMLSRRLELEARLEERAEEAIRALLGPIVGADRLTAQVAVELDFTTREAASERFDREGALRSESISSSTSSEPRPLGIPGALTNTLPAAPQVGPQGPPPAATAPAETQTQSQSATRNFELGRMVEVTAAAGGTIRRMTASVVVDEDALGPPASRAALLQQLRALVEGAIGHDPARGDRVVVLARPFAPAPEARAPIWREPLVIEGAKWLAVALVALGLLFFVVRPLLARWPRAAQTNAPEPPPSTPRPEPRLIDYSAKLTEARLLASTDAARATAVARRLLAETDV
ncbi:MAG: flagellar basal-body MS-ring/collar protein FliF [Sphingomonadaceae bacterium]|uniref:flagellar basal-body MS-ring/collar protein FliF n=1 Tax=Thermaurantiacus sp. TaxID=2820283 RepID=UPI00298F3A15|nr:flagellar basal-body MS-ring/collar protein FliF [Thermaurantiacus sp.]MCS6987013.1 flagellar basal-body MS-ring/collar protein FliF [Sphingomonadaceae bacterium]MDW8415649.1 flagellar basal-body MS-ring/collar protein FliF [Thermaurantiacus sp.]